VPDDDETPSLDPNAIEQNYRRERARRHARTERQNAARRSNIRFFVVLFILVFVTAFGILAAWNEVQTLFGI
jgi:cell division septal protein FtsQ